MTLWMCWGQALWMLRPGCSRLSTFLWFATCVVGVSIRTDNLGVTSIVRAIGLEQGFYLTFRASISDFSVIFLFHNLLY